MEKLQPPKGYRVIPKVYQSTTWYFVERIDNEQQDGYAYPTEREATAACWLDIARRREPPAAPEEPATAPNPGTFHRDDVEAALTYAREHGTARLVDDQGEVRATVCVPQAIPVNPLCPVHTLDCLCDETSEREQDAGGELELGGVPGGYHVWDFKSDEDGHNDGEQDWMWAADGSLFDREHDGVTREQAIAAALAHRDAILASRPPSENVRRALERIKSELAIVRREARCADQPTRGHLDSAVDDIAEAVALLEAEVGLTPPPARAELPEGWISERMDGGIGCTEYVRASDASVRVTCYDDGITTVNDMGRLPTQKLHAVLAHHLASKEGK